MKQTIFVWCGWLALASSASAKASTVRAETVCPQESKESCRWEIGIQKADKDGAPLIRVSWEKSVISRHMDKPLAPALACNVDRDFDLEAGGYLQVWFAGETKPCDASKGAPDRCGVRFLIDKGAHPYFPVGFEVTAPAGRQIVKVENRNTLSLHCGDFAKKTHANMSWDSTVGWDAKRPGDGLYTINRPAQPK